MRKYPSTRTRIVKFGFKGIDPQTPPELLDPAYASEATNFAFEHGCLTGAIGIDPAVNFSDGAQLPDTPLPISDLFFYKFTAQDGGRDDRLVARMTDNSIWSLKLFAAEPTWEQVESLLIKGEDVEAINYNYNGVDRLMFCSKESPLFILDDMTPMYCQSAPSFSCFEMHSERLFGGVNGARTRLWFSDDFDPYNWKVSADEAGYITFDDSFGDILKLMSFLGHLYIFREYGIFRLTAFGKQSEFVLKRVFADTERINKHSIAFAGGSMIFLAGDKLFEFDGYSVRRIAKKLPAETNGAKICAAYLDGYYWISFEYPKGNGKSKLYRYEISTDTFSTITTVDVRNLLAVKTGGNEKMFATFDGAMFKNKLGMLSKSGKLMNYDSGKNYTYAPSTLGTVKQKTVRCINVLTSAKLRVRLTVDDRMYSFELEGSDYLQRIQVGVKGRSIGLTLYTTQPVVNVSPITAELETHAF